MSRSRRLGGAPASGGPEPPESVRAALWRQVALRQALAEWKRTRPELKGPMRVTNAGNGYDDNGILD
jgi:hypothetical protein